MRTLAQLLAAALKETAWTHGHDSENVGERIQATADYLESHGVTVSGRALNTPNTNHVNP